jgi:hypothetical protein
MMSPVLQTEVSRLTPLLHKLQRLALTGGKMQISEQCRLARDIGQHIKALETVALQGLRAAEVAAAPTSYFGA